MIKNDKIELAKNCLSIIEEKGIAVKFKRKQMILASANGLKISTNLLFDVSLCSLELKELIKKQKSWFRNGKI